MTKICPNVFQIQKAKISDTGITVSAQRQQTQALQMQKAQPLKIKVQCIPTFIPAGLERFKNNKN